VWFEVGSEILFPQLTRPQANRRQWQRKQVDHILEPAFQQSSIPIVSLLKQEVRFNLSIRVPKVKLKLLTKNPPVTLAGAGLLKFPRSDLAHE
jgi:hypothetical protein